MNHENQSDNDRELLPLLIEIGRHESYADLTRLFPRDVTSHYLHELNWRIAQYFQSVRNPHLAPSPPEFLPLTFEQMSNLAKALAMAEKVGLIISGCGSLGILEYLKRCNWEESGDLGNWLPQNLKYSYPNYAYHLDLDSQVRAKAAPLIEKDYRNEPYPVKVRKTKTLTESGMQSYLKNLYKDRFWGE